MKKPRMLLPIIADIVLTLAAAAGLVLVNHALVMGIILFAALLAVAVLCGVLGKISDLSAAVLLGLTAAAAVTETAWLAAGLYPCFVAAAVLAALASSGDAVFRIWARAHSRGSGKRAAATVLTVIWILLATLPLLSFVLIAATPAPLMHFLQWTAGVGNSEEAPGSVRISVNGSHSLTTDVRYGDIYPNSFMDVYVSGTEKEGSPLFIFIHGGGYAMGDKAYQNEVYFAPLLNAGYDVISLNYALSPRYTYPEPLVQLTSAIKYIYDHASELGVSTDNIVLAGMSAGGQLAGQLAMIQTNKTYAGSLGTEIPPAFREGDLKALVLSSALIEPARFQYCGNVWVEWSFLHCGRAYFRCDLLESSALAEEASLLRHVSTAFPPTYISDGNTWSFTEQAKDLHARLDDLGVANRLTVFDEKEAPLYHGFERYESSWASLNSQYMLEFLDGALTP